jgi:hypothetical protein
MKVSLRDFGDLTENLNFSDLPSITKQSSIAVTCLTLIWEVISLNLGGDICDPDLGFSVVFLNPPCKFQKSAMI